MKKLELYVSAILAGLMISVGGAVFIGCGKTPVGAVLFAVGLFTVCAWGMALFTGRVGYLIGNRPAYLLDLAVIWLGNLTGTVLVGLALRYAKRAYAETAAEMTAAKLGQAPLQTVLLGVFCGLLMYIAVDHFKNAGPDFGRYVGIFFCVPAFILAGFEHVVADMFYFALGASGEQLGGVVRFLVLCTVGNAIGSFLIPLWKRMKV